VIPSAGRIIPYERRSIDLLRNCVESIVRKSTWDNFEIIAVDNGDLRPGLPAFLDSLGVRRVTYSAEPFNLAQKMNLGAQHASGEHLVFLNDDVEVISPDWIEAMLEFSQQDGIGAVGAKLLFPSNRIQHAGVVLLNGLPGHPYYNHPAEDAGYYRSVQVARNYLAVTGACMMTKTALFRSLEGFDEDFPLNYNDVDYCLRLHDRGERSVYTPHAELYHYESVSRENPRGVGDDEVVVFEEKWKSRYFLDPYYNPNLPADIPYYRVE
jgi:GT2 family glycosyltransferase